MTPREVAGEPTVRGPLVTFFLLTYLVTWTSWLAVWAISDGGLALTLGLLWVCAGYFVVRMNNQRPSRTSLRAREAKITVD